MKLEFVSPEHPLTLVVFDMLAFWGRQLKESAPRTESFYLTIDIWSHCDNGSQDTGFNTGNCLQTKWSSKNVSHTSSPQQFISIFEGAPVFLPHCPFVFVFSCICVCKIILEVPCQLADLFKVALI